MKDVLIILLLIICLVVLILGLTSKNSKDNFRVYPRLYPRSYLSSYPRLGFRRGWYGYRPRRFYYGPRCPNCPYYDYCDECCDDCTDNGDCMIMNSEGNYQKVSLEDCKKYRQCKQDNKNNKDVEKICKV